MTATYAIALALYWILEHYVRKVCYPKTMEPPEPFLPSWKTGQEWTIAVSPGYWIARCLKTRIDHFAEHRVRIARRRFIVTSNKYNLYVSLAISGLIFLLPRTASDSLAFCLLGAIATIRYVSRSFEVGFAFGNDVMRRTVNRSGLSKYTRLQLAFRSYVELFALAAPVYYVHCIAVDWWHSITLSLSVGTLTNIGYAFPTDHSPFANLVFLQVFATLSLVLLSLANYISRERRSNPSFKRTA